VPKGAGRNQKGEGDGMKKWLLGLVFLVLVAAVALWLDPTSVGLGYLRGEAFYRGRPTRYWLRTLRDTDPGTHASALSALKSGGIEALPVLIEIVRNPAGGKPTGNDPRIVAVDLLREQGPKAAEAAPELIKLLQDDDLQIRTVAAAALGQIGASPGDAVPALMAVLKRDRRPEAVDALTTFGPAAKEAIPLLTELLRAREADLRWRAAYALGKLGPGAASAVPVLIAALKDEDPDVREHAAEALGDIGPAAKQATEALAKALQDPSQRVRRDAVRSLGQIGPDARAALPAIRALLAKKDEIARVRDAATKSVQQIEAKPASK
jgi:HEAT repeat protein